MVSDEEWHLLYSHIVEGQCPNGHGPLIRRDDLELGVCTVCRKGWAVRREFVWAHNVDS